MQLVLYSGCFVTPTFVEIWSDLHLLVCLRYKTLKILWIFMKAFIIQVNKTALKCMQIFFAVFIVKSDSKWIYYKWSLKYIMNQYCYR